MTRTKKDLLAKIQEEASRISQDPTAPQTIPTTQGEAQYRFSRLCEDNGLRHIYDVFRQDGTYLRRTCLDDDFLKQNKELYRGVE